MGLTLPFASKFTSNMAGIYIHIPFCKRACHYCNFHFSTSLKLKNAFVDALLKEITIRQNYLAGNQVKTIYLGGGTPSMLDASDLYEILKSVQQHFQVEPTAEVTLEANPDDISLEKLRWWRELGVNRLSIGIQSFFEEDLRWMNRAHDAKQARQCIETAQAEGFENISIDLIYGAPTLTDQNWILNLQTAVAFNIPHLSCYALTVEPGTALDVMTRRKKVPEIASEDQARQFHLMTNLLQSAGYDHYEISNFALPGKRSRHNSAYWSGETYMGLGPSAHSFNGYSRQWNVSNNASYIQMLRQARVPFEVEVLTDVQRFNEYVMTSIRTIEGTDLRRVAERFGNTMKERLSEKLAAFQSKGWVRVIKEAIILTEEGKLFADGIAAELFEEEVHTSTDSIFLKASRG
jgi:oxygen-independent coproporphyrinogen III oxidase